MRGINTTQASVRQMPSAINVLETNKSEESRCLSKWEKPTTKKVLVLVVFDLILRLKVV